MLPEENPVPCCCVFKKWGGGLEIGLECLLLSSFSPSFLLTLYPLQRETSQFKLFHQITLIKGKGAAA